MSKPRFLPIRARFQQGAAGSRAKQAQLAGPLKRGIHLPLARLRRTLRLLTMVVLAMGAHRALKAQVIIVSGE